MEIPLTLADSGKLSNWGNWFKNPQQYLRNYPNGMAFLLKTRKGNIHLCQLGGNMEGDMYWKALNLSTWKYFRLENFKGAQCMVLYVHGPQENGTTHQIYHQATRSTFS
jgi:hypothetical protein